MLDISGLINTVHCATGWCVVQGVSPPSGSLVTNFEGTLNATVFSCNVTTSGLMIEIPTNWIIENFRGISELQIITNDLAPEVFLLTGNEHLNNPLIPLQNILVILNLTSELDGAIIYCGSGLSPQEANFTLRIYSRLTIANAVTNLVLKTFLYRKANSRRC